MSCLELGINVVATIRAPFWPRDQRVSLVPAYIIEVVVSRLDMIRWQKPPKGVARRGVLRVGLRIPGVQATAGKDGLRFDYPVRAVDVFYTGEGGGEQVYRDDRRKASLEGTASDRMVPLDGVWRVSGGLLESEYDLDDVSGAEARCSVALIGFCADPLFERFGTALPMKYTSFWSDSDDVARYVRANRRKLIGRSMAFDRIVSSSPLTPSSQSLMATSFQSYLMCTLWAAGKPVPRRDGSQSGFSDWFSVWEGSCWFNSTVDVTYNEAMLYFACWPELLELLLDEWTSHANDYEVEKRRRARISDDDRHGRPLEMFPGAIMEHDMGAGWSANGVSYHHAMPVEENSNFLLLLYAHGKWWGREELYAKYAGVSRQLAEYLIWADSTGNGFPDRGTANTIDDANPAVQYGRDNVYLGVKRMAGLHAAARIHEHLGDRAFAAECHAEVRKAVRSLSRGWKGDHYPVVLDRSARGLRDSWTGAPLPYKTLPGWDAYSLYTSNGLLYLLMIDDMPDGLNADRLRTDLVNAVRHSMTPYGCSHSSFDPSRMWISMNVWRDCVAAYMGVNLSHLSDCYWAQQVFANGAGAEKANCFTETSLANNLVWYPRGAAAFGLLIAGAGLRIKSRKTKVRVSPVAPGRWPLLPLADWHRGKLPAVVGEAGRKTRKLVVETV
jgi:hypothetical protein